MKRQSRERRRRGVRLLLQPRDVDLLHALARFRIARTSDLLSLCFPGVRRDTAAARLRRLFDASYLDVRAAWRSDENLYSIGPLGKKLLEGSGVSIRCVARGALDHHLAIVTTWVRLATGVPGLELVRVRPDWESREQALAAGGVIPDLLVVLRWEGATATLAVEVDLGSERLTEIRSKIRRYTEVITQAAPDGSERFAVAVVVQSSERAANIRALLDAEYPGPWAVWCEGHGLTACLREIIGSSPAPLTPSPCGKGRNARLTVDSSDDSSAKGQGY